MLTEKARSPGAAEFIAAPELRELKRKGSDRLAKVLNADETAVRSALRTSVRPVSSGSIRSRRVRHVDRLHVPSYEEECRVAAHRPKKDHGPGVWPEPHRARHRIRLLLRARRSPWRGWLAKPSWSTATPRPASTDYDTSDRLYLSRSRSKTSRDRQYREARRRDRAQFGGQTPLAGRALEENGADHRTSPDMIDARRGPRALPVSCPTISASSSPVPRALRSRRPAGCRNRLSAGGAAPATCSVAGRWRLSTSQKDLERYMREASAVSNESPVARPLPQRRHRGGRGCPVGRHPGDHRRHQWAHQQASVHPRFGFACCRPYTLTPKLQDELRRQTERCGPRAECLRA